MNKQSFINLVEQRSQDILADKLSRGETKTERKLGIIRGKQVETVAIELLKTHPNVDKIETQVFEEGLDDFSFIDIVITTKDGRTIYVPCARDLWIGTAQQDRLQCTWLKYKSGVLDTYDVAYLVLTDVDEILNRKVTKRARRAQKIIDVCTTLYNTNNMMNFDGLWEYVSPQ